MQIFRCEFSCLEAHHAAVTTNYNCGLHLIPESSANS